MRKTICKKAGCTRLATPPSKYCSLHQHLEREEEEKKALFFNGKQYSSSWSELYNSIKWKEMSKNQLKNEPLCAICGNKATEVHHKVAHRGNLDLFYNEDNLVSLCHVCHTNETRREINDRRKKANEEFQIRTRHNYLTENYKSV